MNKKTLHTQCISRIEHKYFLTKFWCDFHVIQFCLTLPLSPDFVSNLVEMANKRSSCLLYLSRTNAARFWGKLFNQWNLLNRILMMISYENQVIFRLISGEFTYAYMVIEVRRRPWAEKCTHFHCDYVKCGYLFSFFFSHPFYIGNTRDAQNHIGFLVNGMHRRRRYPIVKGFVQSIHLALHRTQRVKWHTQKMPRIVKDIKSFDSYWARIITVGYSMYLQSRDRNKIRLDSHMIFCPKLQWTQVTEKKRIPTKIMVRKTTKPCHHS